MNVVLLIGRLTADPEIRYANENMAVANYTLAVDRRAKDKKADFIGCKAFGKAAEWAEKYLRKGMKISVEGKIQTGSYTNRDGQKVYTTDVIVSSHEFVESKKAEAQVPGSASGFTAIPDGEELPFQRWR